MRGCLTPHRQLAAAGGGGDAPGSLPLPLSAASPGRGASAARGRRLSSADTEKSPQGRPGLYLTGLRQRCGEMPG